MIGPADLTEIDEDLWRWTVRHPQWAAGAKPESPADWPREVGSVAFAAPDALVLVDPLMPAKGEALWAWLDARVAESDGRAVVLTTVRWHRRSREALVGRYGASTSRAAKNLPTGVETIPIRRAGETMVWIPARRTLVPGDRLLGDDRGGLRLPPASWLGYLAGEFGLDDLRLALRPLLDLDAQRVLVSHGQPVLRGGRDAIARALESG